MQPHDAGIHSTCVPQTHAADASGYHAWSWLLGFVYMYLSFHRMDSQKMALPKLSNLMSTNGVMIHHQGVECQSFDYTASIFLYCKCEHSEDSWTGRGWLTFWCLLNLNFTTQKHGIPMQNFIAVNAISNNFTGRISHNIKDKSILWVQKKTAKFHSSVN